MSDDVLYLAISDSNGRLLLAVISLTVILISTTGTWLTRDKAV
jgi:hypothetical protein